VKANVKRLVAAHYGTLVDVNTGRHRWQDHMLFEGVPVIVGAASFLLGVTIPSSASVGLLTVAGLLSAFLFGVVLQVSQRAMEWSDTALPGPRASRHATLLGEMAANAGYAALVCIAAAVAFTVVAASPNTEPVLLSAVGLAIAVHLVMVLMMVVTRIFAITEQRLIEGRTGVRLRRISRAEQEQEQEVR
jgi:hypothetical protein